ncbi:MAG: CAAD domain-containing protein [Chroococcidiopsidaceae cyanobacterium CP_BM_RX_35]|nr:CAAD domain-containing protein [Chroococcidiopsidaceae cyanobacterium CP_BM_RX_35]
MASPQQSSEFASSLSKLSSNPQIQEKWWWQLGTQLPVWLTQLPDNFGKIFNQYQQPIISIALILAAGISLKVVLAVIAALNELPLMAPTLKLVGIGYSIWFVNRYLLKSSTRQELSQIIQEVLNK